MYRKTLLILIFANLIYYISFSQGWTVSGTNIYNSNTGKVGIGNTAPTTLLDVGNATKTATASNNPYNDIYGLQSRVNCTATAMFSNCIGNFLYTARTVPTVNNTGSFTGLNNWTALSIPGAGGSMGVNGMQSTVEIANSGNVLTANNIIDQGIITTSGTITNYYGYKSLLTHSGTGIISNYYSMYLSPPTGGGSITNKYGLFVAGGTGISFFGDKVGIGTTSIGPNCKLAVEGRIGAREVQVTTTNPFPDYVFDNSYKLISLSDLKAFVNSNKHLPNIPSKYEVMANEGFELGSMTTKLLEKIEELTLYIIEMNEKIEKLEMQNKTLNAIHKRSRK
jgi:hypothetical protein